MNLDLVTQLDLNRYVVKIYKLPESNAVDTTVLESLMNQCNECDYPKCIAELLFPIENVAKLEIFDLNNILLLTMSSIIEG